MHRLGLYAHKAAHGASVETLWQDAVRELESSEEAHRTAERAYTITSVRSDLLGVLRLAESARAPPVGLDTGALAQLYGLPGHLERTLKHPERRKDLHALARSAAKAATDPAARNALLSIARVCKEFRDDAPGLFPERDVRAAYAKAVVALATDAAVDKMIEHVETSLRLSPRERMGPALFTIGQAHFFKHRFEEAAAKLLLSIQNLAGFPPSYRTLAVCYAHMGRLGEARAIITRLRAITPLVLGDLPWRDPEYRELYLSGMRVAMGEAK